MDFAVTAAEASKQFHIWAVETFFGSCYVNDFFFGGEYLQTPQPLTRKLHFSKISENFRIFQNSPEYSRILQDFPDQNFPENSVQAPFERGGSKGVD